MSKNSETINQSLFQLLRSKGFEPTMLSTAGKEIPVPEEAEVFQFNFIKDGKDYGTVTISIDGLHKLIVYFGDQVADSTKETGQANESSWYQVLNQLKRFAQMHQLSFQVNNTDNLKYDMAKREHMKKIDEGYYATGKKSSYSDAVPAVKIILQHNRQLEEGEARYRSIAKIFVENAAGERFLIPTIKPGVARVFARHIAEGGTPYDDAGKHINSLVEEYIKMAGFVRATRNNQFNESTQSLVNEGVQHYQNLRETLHKMSGHRGYTAYFESWSPTLTESSEDTTDLSEMFASNSLDPRIESVMPILRKLNKSISEMTETTELSNWADNLVAESMGDDLEGVAEGLPQTLRKVVPGYARREIDKKMDAGKFGKPDVDRDANFQRYKKIQDKLKEQDVAEGVSLKQKHEDKKRADQNQVRYGKMTQAEFDKKWTRTERPKPTNKEQGVAEGLEKHECGHCHGTGRMVRDPDIGTDQECFVCDGTGYVNDEQGVAEGAPELLKKEMPLHRHAEKLLAQNGVSKDDPDYHHHLNNTIKHLRQFGNIDLINKSDEQGVAGDGRKQQFRGTGNAGMPRTDDDGNVLEQGVAEDLDANQKRVGQLGPVEKVKNNNIGKLVGTDESIEEATDLLSIPECDKEEDPLDRIRAIMNHRR